MKYLMIISITSTISSFGTFTFMTKKLQPEFFNQVVEVAGIQLERLKDPAVFCAAYNQHFKDSPGQDQRNPANNQSDFAEVVRQAQKAAAEREKVLREMEGKREY